MTTIRLRFPLIALFVLAIASPAWSTVVSGTVTGGSAFAAGGTFHILTVPLSNPFGPPDSVGNNTFQSPNLYAFNEDQNIILPVDITPEQGVFLPAGTEVASHYVFFDPGPVQRLIGTVDFDAVVLGILTSRDSLFATDFLANTGVNYLNPSARGLELNEDSVTISGPNQILWNTNASTPGDYVRVLTAHSTIAAPEPSTLALLASAFAGLGALAMRKRR